jgi:hypothetical protein
MLRFYHFNTECVMVVSSAAALAMTVHRNGRIRWFTSVFTTHRCRQPVRGDIEKQLDEYIR